MYYTRQNFGGYGNYGGFPGVGGYGVPGGFGQPVGYPMFGGMGGNANMGFPGDATRIWRAA